MPVRVFLGRSTPGGGKTHPEWKQYCPMGWGPGLNKKENKRNCQPSSVCFLTADTQDQTLTLPALSLCHGGQHPFKPLAKSKPFLSILFCQVCCSSSVGIAHGAMLLLHVLRKYVWFHVYNVQENLYFSKNITKICVFPEDSDELLFVGKVSVNQINDRYGKEDNNDNKRVGLPQLGRNILG